ncbi:MAG: zinc-ribbon domain-containing protein, partial [Deltaproteobacteria bacterium]|nr:zinc-ribbon domain-containing protein [Deltaproteobacteria bacterium]
MIVICEECGKKYQIDPSKIKGKAARFKCKACNHVITVSKPEEKPLKPAPPIPETEKKEEPPKKKERKKREKKEKAPKKPGAKSKVIGLRGKMIILFLLIPIIVIAGAGALYLGQLNNLTSLITNESSKVVTMMAEDAIRSTSRAVAKECNLYLISHPELRKT